MKHHLEKSKHFKTQNEMFLVNRKYCIFSLTTSSCVSQGIRRPAEKCDLGLKANIKFYHKIFMKIK